MTIRFLLAALLATIAAVAAQAQTIPRLDENLERLGELENGEASLLPASQRPAVVDLEVRSDNPDERRFAVAWVEQAEGPLPSNPSLGIGFAALYVAIVDAEGDPIAGPDRIATFNTVAGQYVGSPAVVADSRGFFSVIWSLAQAGVPSNSPLAHRLFSRTFRISSASGELCPADGIPIPNPDFSDFTPGGERSELSSFDQFPELGTQTLNNDYHELGGGIFVDAGADASGDVVIVAADHRATPEWGVYAFATFLETEPEDPALPECEQQVAWLFAPASGRRVAENGTHRVVPRVAVSPNDGSAMIVWRARNGNIEAALLNGATVGDRIVVASPSSTQESHHDPDVAFDNSGFFRVVWERSRYADEDAAIQARRDILMSSYDLDGRPGETAVRLSTSAGDDFFSQQPLRVPRISRSDADGDFAASWTQPAGQCPGPGSNWGVNVASFCTPDNPAAQTGARCRISLTGGGGPCWRGLRILPHPATETTDWAFFERDAPIEFPTAQGGVDLVLSSNPTSNLNRCVYVETQGRDGPRRAIVEQRCSPDLSFCVSCEDQLSARGLEMPEDSPVLTVPPPASAPTGRGGAGDTQVLMRWLPREYQSGESTVVEPTVVSDQTASAETATIAMGRDGDMLIGWIQGGRVTAEGQRPTTLVTQNLAGPVELQVNDLGILEGPPEGARATANFTITANKPYPALIEDACPPRPRISTLTEDDTAQAAEGDYVRTEELISFGRCDEPQPLTMSVPVEILDDELYEGTESFRINLFEEENAIVVRRQGIGVILDNDNPSLVQVPDLIVEICENGALPAATAPRCPEGPLPGDEPALVELRVQLNTAQAVEGGVNYSTADGSALEDADYGAVSGELQFLPGVTEVVLAIDLIDDGLSELDEQFFVQFDDVDALTLPENPDERRIIVNVLDNDSCDTPATWVLPPDADGNIPSAPEQLPAVGTEAERTGYLCVSNPQGFDQCEWASELDREPTQASWLTLTDVQFADPGDPSDVIAAAQAACAGAVAQGPITGAVRYIAEENLPAGNAQINDRELRIELINGQVESERPAFSVRQTGGDCTPILTPDSVSVFPVGGTVTVEADFGGQQACDLFAWDSNVVGDTDWVSIIGATSGGTFRAVGPATLELDIDPFAIDGEEPLGDRLAIVSAGGTDLPIVQEAPFFDHFADGIPPDPAGWTYTDIDAWTEADTWLTASTLGTASVIADQAFEGCSDCRVDARVRFDAFGKGTGTIYLWWRSEQEYLALTVDEFADEWRLTQRIGGTDYLIKTYDRDVLVGQEYSVEIDFRDDLPGVEPILLIDIDGLPMCPLPGPGLTECIPARPDPAGEPFVGSGTVGLGVEFGTVSFNLLQVIRSDTLDVPVGTIFFDGFE